ncbi:MAG: hypothetical protein U0325_30705 [Polyangiales bacterium]
MAETLPVVHERGVRRALKLLQGGGAPLVVCVCASTTLRARVEAELAERLAPRALRVAEIGDDPWRVAPDEGDTVLSLGTRGATAKQWQALNVGREIRVRRGLAMLLWIDGLTEYAMLPERAADLWSHRAEEVFFLSHEEFAREAAPLQVEAARDPDAQLKDIEKTLRSATLDPVARLYALDARIDRLSSLRRTRELLNTLREAMERYDALRFQGDAMPNGIDVLVRRWRGEMALVLGRYEDVLRAGANAASSSRGLLDVDRFSVAVSHSLYQMADIAASARVIADVASEVTRKRVATAHLVAFYFVHVLQTILMAIDAGLLRWSQSQFGALRSLVRSVREDYDAPHLYADVEELVVSQLGWSRGDARGGFVGLIRVLRVDGVFQSNAAVAISQMYGQLGLLREAVAISSSAPTSNSLSGRDRHVAERQLARLRAELAFDRERAGADCDTAVAELERQRRRAPMPELATLTRLEIASLLAVFEDGPRADQALEHLDIAVRESDALASIDHSARSRDQRAAFHATRGRHAEAITDLRWLIEHCVERWGPSKRAGWMIRLGESLHATGVLEEARATYDLARIEWARDPEDLRSLTALKNLALARHRSEVALGDLRAARSLLDEALAATREEEHRLFEVELLHARAELAPATPDDDPREADARLALEIARKALWIRDEARAMANLAACHLRRGRVGPARALLEESHWIARELKDKNVLPRVEAVLAMLAS